MAQHNDGNEEAQERSLIDLLIQHQVFVETDSHPHYPQQHHESWTLDLIGQNSTPMEPMEPMKRIEISMQRISALIARECDAIRTMIDEKIADPNSDADLDSEPETADTMWMNCLDDDDVVIEWLRSPQSGARASSNDNKSDGSELHHQLRAKLQDRNELRKNLTLQSTILSVLHQLLESEEATGKNSNASSKSLVDPLISKRIADMFISKRITKHPDNSPKQHPRPVLDESSVCSSLLSPSHEDTQADSEVRTRCEDTLDWTRTAIMSRGKSAARTLRETVMLPSESSEIQVDFPHCSVSQIAYSIVQKFREITQLINSESSSRITTIVYDTAITMIQLFRLLVPYQWESTLEELPQLGMQFYNDCMFIAHELELTATRLPIPSQLAPPLNRHATSFTDLASAMRELGQFYCNLHINKQRAQLYEYVRDAAGFANIDNDKRYHAVEMSFRKTTHHLNLLDRLWKDTLPQEEHQKVMSLLIDDVLCEIALGIERVDEIGEDESERFVKLLGSLLSACEQLVPNVVRPESGESAMPNFLKCRQLINIMNMRLVDIIAGFNSGGELSKSFCAEEIRTLVRALFADTALRQQSLRRLRDSADDGDDNNDEE